MIQRQVSGYSFFGAWVFGYLNEKVLLRDLGFFKAEVFGLTLMMQAPLFESSLRPRTTSQ